MATEPILIVDDNPTNLKVARFALEAEGYQVRTAADGEAMFLVLREFRPRMILMDIQLPGIDGIELTRQLKAAPGTRDIVVVAVTAYAMTGDREKALGAGCNGYITKPLDPIRLPAQIAKYLGHAPSDPPLSPAASMAKAILPHTPKMSKARLILVVEDNVLTSKMFRATLEGAGFEVAEAPDARTALDLVAQRRPNLIVQDLTLPDMDGLELAHQLRGMLEDHHVPIICASGFLCRLDERRASGANFDHVLVKPVDPDLLLETVKLHLAAPFLAGEFPVTGQLLLVVDDDPLQCKLAQAVLSNEGFNVLVASDGRTALELARRQHPAAIVSDVLMPDMDGFSLCLAVRLDPELAAIPVVLISSVFNEDADRKLADHVGASALLSKVEGTQSLVRAVADVLQSTPPVPLSGATDLLQEEHSVRTLWQLERQLQQNALLRQRCSQQETRLAVLGGVATALEENRDIDGVLGDVLASCLDMAGISKGALYLMERDSLTLKHMIGLPVDRRPQLQDAFGCQQMLRNMTRYGKIVSVPSSACPEHLAHRLMMGVGVPSLMLIPVKWSSVTYGLIMLGARTADIEGVEALSFARIIGAQIGQAIGLAAAFTTLDRSKQSDRSRSKPADVPVAMLR